MQSTQTNARSGWRKEEADLLWHEVRQVSEQGETLKAAFDRTALKTGRRPNSIRNYYYQSIKAQEAPDELCTLRAQPFVPFTQEEVTMLLREILTDRAKGISVRACVQRLGEGDRARALRYQNKYRSILKSHPEQIEQVLRDLRKEGIEASNPYETLRAKRQRHMQAGRVSQQADFAPDDHSAVAELMRALRNVMNQQGQGEEIRHREQLDRMTVRCDLLRLELARREEQLIDARKRESDAAGALAQAAGLMEVCRELLGADDVMAARENVRLREQLAQQLSNLENAISRSEVLEG